MFSYLLVVGETIKSHCHTYKIGAGGDLLVVRFCVVMIQVFSGFGYFLIHNASTSCLAYLLYQLYFRPSNITLREQVLILSYT